METDLFSIVEKQLPRDLLAKLAFTVWPNINTSSKYGFAFAESLSVYFASKGSEKREFECVLLGPDYKIPDEVLAHLCVVM